MVIYEMNLIIQPNIYDRYIDWLHTHIKELLTLPGFYSAQLLHELSPDTDYYEHRCTVVYKIDSMKTLDYFFTYHENKIYHDNKAEFSNNISSNYRVFEISTEVVNH